MTAFPVAFQQMLTVFLAATGTMLLAVVVTPGRRPGDRPASSAVIPTALLVASGLFAVLYLGASVAALPVPLLSLAQGSTPAIVEGGRQVEYFELALLVSVALLAISAVWMVVLRYTRSVAYRLWAVSATALGAVILVSAVLVGRVGP